MSLDEVGGGREAGPKANDSLTASRQGGPSTLSPLAFTTPFLSQVLTDGCLEPKGGKSDPKQVHGGVAEQVGGKPCGIDYCPRRQPVGGQKRYGGEW